ncbi:hypothetical protein CHARACLAT_027741 [Characodon lateralis]|uniref:Uncharacterized protein n=1 Tax=Characodon lateralis TaxID=208331 RepID=A0ABU7DKD8_9TELE|nr:hypothetical protein [Characodon lateralis]
MSLANPAHPPTTSLAPAPKALSLKPKHLVGQFLNCFKSLSVLQAAHLRAYPGPSSSTYLPLQALNNPLLELDSSPPSSDDSGSSSRSIYYFQK